MQQVLPTTGPEAPTRFADVESAVRALRPREPMYCVFPGLVERAARRFIDGFPGRVLYAVKANPHPLVLAAIGRAGVDHFDVASISEIALVASLLPDATLCFMAPVKPREAVREAFEAYGVRHFVIDHANELDKVVAETRAAETIVFVRLSVHSPDAYYDFSSKFGANPEDTVALLRAVADSGAEPGLAFNLGSMVMNPAEYGDTVRMTGEVLRRAGVAVRHLDVGGGFSAAYPGLDAPPCEDYFAAITEALPSVPLGEDPVVMAEPGRALVAEGLSMVARVILCIEDGVFLNEGIYGSLGEPGISRGRVMYPTRILRADGSRPSDRRRPFTLYGPTCDGLDALPRPFDLPEDIAEGDWVEFGMMGAYTVSTRNDFNGFFASRAVEITDPAARPPGVA